MSRLTPVAFDDADEKMTRDEIEYMLTNSEETLDADEIEMLQGIFSSASSKVIGVKRLKRLVDADKSQTKGLTSSQAQ